MKIHQIESLQYDYRQTFSTIFQDFMGADINTINSSFITTPMKVIVETKINGLIEDSHLVPEDCYDITSNSSINYKVFPTIHFFD